VIAASACLSRWGSHLPSWVCALGGQHTPQQVSAGVRVLTGAVTAALLMSLAGVIYEWRRSGLSFRDWLDSLR
jgi:hypothetical protein